MSIVGQLFGRKAVELTPSIQVASPCIGEVVLSDGRFVTVYQIKAAHMLAAHKMVNSVNYTTHDYMLYALGIMKQCARIDGEELSTAECYNLTMEDFNKISTGLFNHAPTPHRGA
jgi:hypothetical protein